jgi:glycosyltransferase involved in cell wall biosynthesis
MSGPLVSVVVPAFNAERFLARTLQSARAQTWRALEIIVVDDGSSDGTPEIVRAQAAVDPRLRLVRQENAGVAAARNRGIAVSGGAFVAPLDADDLWHPEKIERQLRRFQERPQAAVVYCWSVAVDEDDGVIPQQVSPAEYEGDVLAAAVFQDFIGGASVPLIRRECLQAVGGFDERLRAAGAEGCEDRKLYIDLAERYDFALVPAFLVGYRQVARSMSRDHARMFRSYDLVMSQARLRRPDLPRRLFRWGYARGRLAVGIRAAANGQYKAALALCAAALRHDPTLAASRWFRGVALRGLRKAVGAGAPAPSRGRMRFPDGLSPPPLVEPDWALLRRRRHVEKLRLRGAASAPTQTREPGPLSSGEAR